MKQTVKRVLSIFLAMVLTLGMVPAVAAGSGDTQAGSWLTTAGQAGDFPLAKDGTAATLWVDAKESQPVKRVVDDFKTDIKRVTGLDAAVSSANELPQGPVVIIGTLDTSDQIKALIAADKITAAEVSAIQGKWEAYLIKVVDANTLVVVGSDPRGAVFGAYEISETMGVSPWHYFADVPVQTKTNVYIAAGTSRTDMPDVQYRGIFLNDEEKLSRWVNDVFNKAEGGSGIMGAKIYGKIFELILRLKGNYIWAAMHVNSINNIPANIDAIHEYGIVLGSSHCDMLLRTNTHEWSSWKSNYDKANGTNVAYDYTVNPEVVLQYWRENIIRHKDTEAQWTLGMRGAHDEPFNTAKINDQKWKDKYGEVEEDRKAGVLSEIIAAQEALMVEVLGQEKADKAFKAFIPYKEVLPLYNNPKFTMSDDITVIWCDDNHGMVRRTPSDAERLREGGSGLYYHVSYWAPADQSYLWMSSLPLSVMGEELNKSWETGIQKSWVLNIGDIKPNEGEMDYFIRCGWDVDKYTGNAEGFEAEWMERNFGSAMDEAKRNEVADILTTFYQHTNVRKVDHMRLDIFEQTNYNEWDKRMAVYQDLFDRTQAVANTLNADQQLAFYELVQSKINWAYLTNKMFYYADKSTLAYDQGRMASADAFSKLSIETELARKSEIAKYGTMANAKWKGFIDPENHSPPVTTQLPGTNPAMVLGDAAMGVIVQGEVEVQTNSALTFSPYNQDGKFIDVFNKGAGSFNWTATASADWVKLSAPSGTVTDEARLWVTIDGIESHKGQTATITITDTTNAVTKTIAVTVENPTVALSAISGYAEADGYVSMQAEHYTKKNDAGNKTWQLIVNGGRGFDGDMARAFDPAFKAVDESAINAENAPSLEYNFTLTSSGTFPLEVYRLPTMNATPDGKIRFAVSVDDQTPIVISSTAIDEGTTSSQNPQWRENLYRQIERHVVALPELAAGTHTLKLWMVDNLIVIDKMVIYTGADGVVQSALGPDESYHSVHNNTFTASVPVLARDTAAAEPKDIRADWGTGAFQEAGGKVAIEAEYAMENDLSSKDQITEDMSAYTVSKWDEAAKWTDPKNPNNKKLSNKWRLTQTDTGLGVRLPDVGTSWTEGPDFPVYAPELTYKVDFSTLGTYRVWVRWRLVDNSGDSLRAGLNNNYAGSFPSDQMWKYENDEKWFWKEVGPIKVTAQGVQPFSVWMREDGLYIDRVYLTTGAETPNDNDWQESYRGGAAEADIFKQALEAKKKEIDGYSYPVGDGVGSYSKAAYGVMMTAMKDAEALAASGNVAEEQGNAAIKAIDDAWKALAATQQRTDGSVSYYGYRDFENDSVGKFPYGVNVLSKSAGATIAIMEEKGNKYLHLATTSSDKNANLSFPYSEAVTANADERIVIEMMGRFKTGQFSSIALPYGSNKQQGMFVAFDNASSKHQVSVITNGNKKDSGAFNYDQWHAFKIVADMAAKTYTVYMDEVQLGYKDGGETKTVYNFRNSVTDLINHTLGIEGFSDAEADFDDIRVSVISATSITPITGTVTIDGTAQWGQTLTANVTQVTSAAGDSLTYVWKNAEGVQVGTGKTYVPTESDVGKTLTVTVKATGAFIGGVTSEATGTVVTADNTQGAALKAFVDAERAELAKVSIPVGSGLGCYGYDEYTALTDALDAAETLAGRVPTAEMVTAEEAKVEAAWTALKGSFNLSEGGLTYNAYRDFSADETGKFPYGITAATLTNGTAAIMEEKGKGFLRLTTASAGGNADMFLPYAQPVTPDENSRMVVEYRARFVNDAGQYANGMMIRNTAGKDNYSFTTVFDNGGYQKYEHNIKVHDGGKTAFAIGKFEPGVWQNIKMIADWTSKTYTVYVNDQQMGYVKDGTRVTTFTFRDSNGTGFTGQRFGSDKKDCIIDYAYMKAYVANPADILSVSAVPATTAPLGSTIETVKGRLPETVSAILGDGSTRDLAVTWACDGTYDPAATTAQTFTGTLTVPEGITNSKGLTVTASVTLTKLKIACVGDSVTYGSNGKGGQVAAAERYPNQLAVLLDNRYEVGNFGVSGATMVSDGTDKDGVVKGYANLSAFTDSLNFAPDVVVVMLGTNDAKGLNWDNYKNNYVRDALDMIKTYQNLKSKPLVYVATSPTVLAGANDYGIQGNVVHDQIVKLQRQIALAAGAGFIDVHEATKGATIEQFPDLVHGNKAGYAMIAGAVKDAIAAVDTPEASPIQTVDTAKANTVAGYVPELPFAAVTYADGTKGVASVDWDLTDKRFDTAGTVEVTGALTGLSAKTTTLTVTVTEAKLAKAVSATATSRETANPDANAIDDKLDTRWAASNDKAPQDVVIELDGVYKLDQISIVWFDKGTEKRKYQYDVEASTDGETYTKVVDRSANGRVGTVTDDMKGTEAKYVKIHVMDKSKGSISIWEVDLFGEKKAEEGANAIVISGMTNGSVTASPTSAKAGVEVTLTVTPDVGYQLKAGTLKAHKTGDAAETVTIAANKFTMPAYGVTVTAEFEPVAGESTPIGGAVAITGTAAFGEILTADMSGVTPANAQVTCAWTRGASTTTIGTASTYTLTADDIGETITLTVTGDGDYTGTLTSDPTAAVEKATQAAPVGVGKTDETAAEAADGTLTGVAATMEWSVAEGASWTRGTGEAVTVPVGTYWVRCAGTDTHKPSTHVVVTVRAFGALPQEETPAAEFDAADMSLSNLAEGMKYSVDGGETWLNAEGENADLSELTLSTTHGILVYMPGDGGTTDDSEQQMIGLTKAATPVGVGKTDETAAGSGGTLTGVTSDMEYSGDDGATWTAVTGTTVENLEPKTYQVRVAGKGTVLASGAVTLVIAAYVPEEPDVAVDGVTLNRETLSINVGDTARLTATVTPEDATDPSVTWTSSDTNVVTVDEDGLVTAKANGTATITVKTVDGGFEAECQVTVTTYVWSDWDDDTTTETEKNEDGSTTKIVTNKTTGKVTETTKWADGTKSVVVTTKDGTVTQNITRPDGTKLELVNKPDGSATSKVTDPKGVSTNTTTTAQGETTAQVRLPKGVETAKVTIPVKDATLSTVAVLVKADGTEEIIKTTVLTEDGVRLAVSGNTTLKLVDNAKTFGDVDKAHWAADAVTFVTSRELFSGTAQDVFDLDVSMGRGMLFAVLARLEGVDTTGGETWYSKAMEWSVSAGISDGSDPDATVTREQLATMLYRYAGQPTVEAEEGAETAFTDGDSVSQWAADAMTWAVNAGILTGKDGARLDPAGTASRAEVATILMRFIETHT